jgi:dolichol-phosphate mannosyltransferase
MLWLIGAKLIEPQRSITGWTSVMVAVLFLGGVQLVSIGLLGEYIGRIFRQTKGRPLYVVARRVNFPSPAEAIGSPAGGARREPAP